MNKGSILLLGREATGFSRLLACFFGMLQSHLTGKFDKGV